jgi:hypothetical protein
MEDKSMIESINREIAIATRKDHLNALSTIAELTNQCPNGMLLAVSPARLQDGVINFDYTYIADDGNLDIVPINWAVYEATR